MADSYFNSVIEQLDHLRVVLTQNKETKCDNTDHMRDVLKTHRFHASYMHGVWYAVTQISGKIVYMHHFVIPAVKGQDVHHKNNDGLDNRAVNLVSVSHAANCVMRHRLHPKNKTGITGLREDIKGSAWRIQWNGLDGKQKERVFTWHVHGGKSNAKELASKRLAEEKAKVPSYKETLSDSVHPPPIIA